ncbi:MAG: hypothetical protein J6Q79_05285 [Clostridia bacterium]|nr:hypothetical protein [Clostridia bacterium]
MKINFINKSDKDIYITMNDESITVNDGERKSLATEEAGTFTVQINENSYVTYIVAKFGVVLKRHFKVRSEYAFDMGDDITVVLTTDKKKGKFMDEYERAVCMADNGRLTLLGYRVPDEERLKRELAAAIRRSDNTLKIFDLFDILGNGLAAALFLLIPFAIIWIFSDVRLAAEICTIAFIPIFALIICLNRFFDKLKRKLWKSARSAKLKNQIFKDYHSYFDSEYIESVLN